MWYRWQCCALQVERVAFSNARGFLPVDLDPHQQQQHHQQLQQHQPYNTAARVGGWASSFAVLLRRKLYLRLPGVHERACLFVTVGVEK